MLPVSHRSANPVAPDSGGNNREDLLLIRHAGHLRRDRFRNLQHGLPEFPADLGHRNLHVGGREQLRGTGFVFVLALSAS